MHAVLEATSQVLVKLHVYYAQLATSEVQLAKRSVLHVMQALPAVPPGRMDSVVLCVSMAGVLSALLGHTSPHLVKALALNVQQGHMGL